MTRTVEDEPSRAPSASARARACGRGAGVTTGPIAPDLAGGQHATGSPDGGFALASATSVAPTSASVGTYARPRAISRAASPFPRNHRQSRSSSAQNRTPPATATSGRPTAASPATVAVATEGASTRTRKRPTPSTTRKRPSRQASALGTSSAMISPSPRGSSRRAFGTGGGAGAGASAVGGLLDPLPLRAFSTVARSRPRALPRGSSAGRWRSFTPRGRRERHLDRQAGGGVAVVEAHVRDRLVRHRGGADYPNDRSEGGKRSCEARRRPEGRGASGDAKRRTNRSRHTCPRRADEHARRGVRRPRATPLWGPGIKSSLAWRNNEVGCPAYSSDRRGTAHQSHGSTGFSRDARHSHSRASRRVSSATTPARHACSCRDALCRQRSLSAVSSNVASVSPRHIGDSVRPLIPK